VDNCSESARASRGIFEPALCHCKQLHPVRRKCMFSLADFSNDGELREQRIHHSLKTGINTEKHQNMRRCSRVAPDGFMIRIWREIILLTNQGLCPVPMNFRNEREAVLTSVILRARCRTQPVFCGAYRRPEILCSVIYRVLWHPIVKTGPSRSVPLTFFATSVYCGK
jgi:hypothetical protein